MKLSNLLRRSLALLLLVAMSVSFVPNVFAQQESGIDFDNIQIEVPDELQDEDVVVATFGEDGKIRYEAANDDVRATINVGGQSTSAVTDSSGTEILENRANPAMAKQQRLAFFIDPSNSEGTSNYVTFSLTAAMVKNLVAAGVTDLFVMVKPKAGGYSLTDLKTANSNKGSAKVYAWVHCARDDAYLASNKTSAQYHFRAGYNNAQNGGDTSVSGFVHLANSGYVTYMKGIMEEANDYADGLLLDSLLFGTEYMGWDQDARDYMGKDYYNEAVKAMCARAYEQYKSTYRYKADSNGYYAYVSSGGSTNTDGDTLYDIRSTDAGTKFRDYRRSVINTFIKEMRSAFGTSKIISVALERDYAYNFQNYTVRGLYPYGFRNYISNGFVVTMQVGDNHTTAPTTLAKTMAKYTNVMVGVDFYKVGTVGNYGYTVPDTVTDVAEAIFTARYQVAGDYATYRGYILGAACYTMGHVGAVKVSLSDSGTSPTMTATIANPNHKTVAMLTYFNKHGDTDCTPNTTYGVDTVEEGTMHYYAQSGYVTSYSPLTNSSISAFGGRILQVKLKNYTVDWDKLPFIRFGFYPIYDFGAYTNTVAHFPIYIIANHSSCTSFTTTWIAQANCTTKGFKQHVCKTCGYTYIEEVAKTAHSYTSKVTTQPTCEGKGVRTYTCSVCSNSYTEDVDETGHDYVGTVTTPATCLTDGVKTYTCQNDASHTYTEVIEATGHEWNSAGVCINCGLSTSKLLHFKEGSAEAAWSWDLHGGSLPHVDTTGDGILYGSTLGLSQAYFDHTSGYIGYKIAEGDVIQIRIRVTPDADNVLTSATPTIRFDTVNTGSGFNSSMLTADRAIDLLSDQWQIINFTVTADMVGDTIERVRVFPFGTQLALAEVEIDYIHFGAEGTEPITVTFKNGETVLQVSTIAPGTKVTYYGATPTKTSSAGFVYTFSGWQTEAGVDVDLANASFAVDTVLIAQFTAERVTNPDPIASNKNIVDNDGNLEDYKYDIEIDVSTYGKEVTINKEYMQPLDITIVMDRSTSVCFPADESNTSMTWTVTNNSTSLTNVLNKLDKTKPEGYYTATNWLGVDFVGPTDEQAGGYISYEDMRWNGSEWQVWQTIELYTEANNLYNADTTLAKNLRSIYTDGYYQLVAPGSVLYDYSNYTYHHSSFGKWVSMKTAYNDFVSRVASSFSDSWETSHGLSGYTQSNMKFKIAVSRRGAMQEALCSFIDKLVAGSSNLPNGYNHRVSIVSYGYQAYVPGESFTYTNASGTTRTRTCTTDPGVYASPTVLTASSATTLKNIIKKPFAFGATATDNALTYAKQHQASMKGSSTVSQGVVILITDGAPTYGDGFFIDTANAALTQAKSMKTSGVKVFSVGYMDGLNSATGVKAWSDTDTIANQSNSFLHLISSNYPNAASMTSHGSGGSSSGGFYMSDTSGTNLATIMGNIFNIIDSKTNVQTQITEAVEVKDVVTREWNVLKLADGSYDVTVARCDYLGDGQFAAAATIDNTGNQIYTLTTVPCTDANGNETGETKIDVVWHDAPNAWLREKEDVTDGSTYYGYKLLITIGIELDSEATLGGNNIPTNTSDSGIYYAANDDLSHKYEVPNINVEVNCDYIVHDFFLDFDNDNAEVDLLDILANPDKKAEYLELIYRSLFTRIVDTDGLNNQYVDIQYFAGDEAYYEDLAPGEEEWVQTLLSSDFDFLSDQTVPVGYVIQPLKGSIDSLGRAPFSTSPTIQTAYVNYYAPKYAVVDYDSAVAVPLGNENPNELTMTLGANGTFNDAKTHVLYDFRNTASEDRHIMNGMEVINYTVTAKNTPKGASSNQVDRKIYVIPANTVEYDQLTLSAEEYPAGSGYIGKWTTDGTPSTANQTYDNSAIHGYDAALANQTYSFGSTYVTTVSSNIRDDNGNITEYHNNNALSFTFTGTGFDILSQTGPNEGTVIVEAYAVTNGVVSTKVAARYMVDNYMAGQDLYQLPIVHCTDLAYGTYKVVIRAFYNDAFNHYATKDANMKGVPLMTEARIRNILGLSDDEPLVYSLSEDRAKATRAMTASSYDVHVDGVRIYNTLGELSSAKNPIAYAVYGNEANAQFVNARDLLLDSKSWLQTVENGQNVEGVVYIAASGENVGSSATDSGYHLSMDGIMNHELADGKYYVLDSSNKRVTHPTYGTDIYFKLNADGTMVNTQSGGKNYAAYFCMSSDGKSEITLTSTEFSKIIGKENIVYYSSTYEVSGPKNEIYLSGNSGIAFRAAGATLLQVSLNSLNGSAVVLQAYDWTDKKFVAVTASTVSATAMYYDLSDYIDTDGTVLIRNSGSGIISLSNIKVVGAEITAPVSSVAKALTLLQYGAQEQEVHYDEELALSTAVSIGAEMQIVYSFLAQDVASYDSFYVEITKDVTGEEAIVVTFTPDGGFNAILPIVHPKTGEIVGYQVIYTGINAMEMGDEFTAILYAVNADGDVYCGDIYTDSIQNYLMRKIEAEDSSDELKTLAVDMLNYGAAAQLNFGYNVENLVNADLTEEQRAYGTSAMPDAVDSMSATDDGVQLMTNVSLQSKVMLYISCMYATEDASNLKFVITDASNGDVIAELDAEKVRENAWRCIFSEVGASQMRKLIGIELQDNGVKVSNTVVWSVESYVAQVCDNEATSEELRNVVTAMLVYGDSAAAYLALSNQ